LTAYLLLDQDDFPRAPARPFDEPEGFSSAFSLTIWLVQAAREAL